MPQVEPSDNPRFAFGASDVPYLKELTWNGQFSDLYVVDLKNGELGRLCAGHDFYAAPKPYPAGDRLAFTFGWKQAPRDLDAGSPDDRPLAVAFDFVELSDLDAVRGALKSKTRLVMMETPSNPLLKLCDIAAIGSMANGSSRESLRPSASRFPSETEMIPTTLSSSADNLG